MRKFCLAMAMAGMLAGGLGHAGLVQAQTTIRIGLQDDPDVLDPARARTFVGRIVFASLCDKLVDITPDLKFAPQLARSWSTSPDGLTLTLKLRTDALFHDGAPVDAAAVKANLDRARTLPDSNRKSELATIASVEAPDKETVVLKLSEPDASLLSQLSDRAGMMLSPATFGKDPGSKPVCSGPYQFKERVQNDRIVLEKFGKYWDAANYHFDRVVFTPMPDSTVRLNNLRAGDLDIIERVAPSDAKTVKGDASLRLAPVTGLGFQAISVNIANGARADNPLAKDKRVRQALDLAIDRDVLNQVVGEGMFQPAYQPFPPASFAYDKAFEHGGRDPQKARALLKQAGYDRVKFEITYGNNTTMQQVFELVQAMGAEAGFDITLRPVEFASLQSSLARGDFQVGQSGWSGRVDPSGNIHQYLSCKGNLNDGKFCDPEADKLLNAARAESDTAKRRELYDKVLSIMQDQRPIVYLFYLPWTFGVQKKIEGFVPYPDGLIRLKGVTAAK
ncbi:MULTISPECIES: ABC transporter substrate-binding protein [unclassified Achromobacter]|uniref:ABC transporter substrate-binding protein n=1 Tax=unclassified Achromobacter TaxID=2626865 RepID=UPI00069D48B9|nr:MULTISPECIES: ABC transporter substrate-binding protein [unclassified Achromobacter]KOF52162.1 ABC transporter substrate-binding protein [Achromobacter sp. DMS1]